MLVLQNRYVFGLLVGITVAAAAALVFFGLAIYKPPRSYAEIIATPTVPRPPATETLAVTQPPPTPTRRPIPPTPALALADDFSTLRNWTLRTASLDVTATLTDSEYVLQFVRPVGSVVQILNGFALTADDFTMQVDAYTNTPANADYGLVFWHGSNRRTLDESYLYLAVNSVVGFRVRERLSPDRVVDLVPRTPSRAIRAGSTFNNLRVDGHGNRLLFFINGSLVADLDTPELATFRDQVGPDGRVGLVAGTSETNNIEVHFANFRVFANSFVR